MGWVEIASELDAAHQHFIDVAARLPADLREKPGVCGVWSPKAVVAHLAGWDREATHALGLFADGQGETYNPNIDGDAFNAKSVADREHLSWAAVLDDLAAAHAALQAMFQRLDAAGLDAESGFGRAMLGRKTDYDLHAGQLEAWL